MPNPAGPHSTEPARPARAVLFTGIAALLDAALLALALGGPAALLAHPRAIALLVLWTANNVVLAALRPVRRHDAVVERADARFVMPALFLLPLLAPPVSALGERVGLWTAPWQALPAAAARGLAWGGVGLAAVGLAIRIASMNQLRSRFSARIAVQRDHALETNGMYARVRHPGYLGSLLATAGGTLAFRSALGWPLVVLMVVAQTLRARREETTLEQHFGGAYRDYRRRSGMFLPPLRRGSLRAP
jgi:protein-S-isoprenylcysteine O-methyltransferase Ste14